MQHVYHPDDTLDGYHIVEHLADGAFAAVYRATRVETRAADDVVLKIPHPFVLDRPALASHWRREVALTAGLHHPHIQRQLHPDAARSYPYLVLEYAGGGSVRTLLNRQGPVAWSQSLVWGTQLAEVLVYLHGLGIVHRDLKPDNLLLTDTRQLKLGDFGAAVRLRRLRLLPTGVVDPLEGTPDYLAPEQLKGDPGGPQSDIYSWGIVMFELLTGSAPFTSDDPEQTMTAHLQAELPLIRDKHPGVPAGLEAVVRRATRRSMSERYKDAASLLHDLEHLDQVTLDPDLTEPQRSMGEPSFEGLASLARFAALISLGFIGLVALLIGLTIAFR
jgi:eukaryotic-like serine/threonine-protein kinase